MRCSTGWRCREAGSRAERIGQFAAGNEAAIGALIDGMANEIALDTTTRDLDVLLASLDPAVWPTEARREVLVNYLGFPFWDVQTLAMTNWRDMVEFDEILVDRISPNDAKSFTGIAATRALKCTGLAHFAGFFSRGYREHDYLLGRLHGIDRLIDIVCDAAGTRQDDRYRRPEMPRLPTRARRRGKTSAAKRRPDPRPAP